MLYSLPQHPGRNRAEIRYSEQWQLYSKRRNTTEPNKQAYIDGFVTGVSGTLNPLTSMHPHGRSSEKGCVGRKEVYVGKLCLHRTIVEFVPDYKIVSQKKGLFRDM